MHYLNWIYLFVFIVVSLHGNYTYAQQSKLPTCPGEYKISKSLFGDGPDERWNNCFGKSSYGNQTYLGEWREGLPHGQGLLKYQDNTYILAFFNKQKPEGYVISFEESGKILWSGLVENSKRIRKEEVDYRKFDTRLTQKFVDKAWKDYFSVIQSEGVQGYFECVQTGLSYYKIFNSYLEYPDVPPDLNKLQIMQGKCKNFIDNNKFFIQKISKLSFECPKDKNISQSCVSYIEKEIGTFSSNCSMNKSFSECDAHFISEDLSKQEHRRQAIDKFYELAFSEKNWRFISDADALIASLEFEVKKAEMNSLKEAERKEVDRKEAERKEAERKEAERKEAERKEAERKDGERKEAGQRQFQNEVNASGKTSSPHYGTNIFSCSGSFAGESLVEMYSLSLIKLWSQNKKIDFAEAYLESNKRLVPFGGRCNFSGVDPYIKFPTRPNGQRIVVTKIGIEEYVLYRTQGSFGVAFVAQIEKPVTEENKHKKSKEAERRENVEKIKKSDKKTDESKFEDKIILQNLTKQFEKSGLIAYKAQGSACSKGTVLDSLYRENIAKRYKSPLSLVNLIRVNTNDTSCDAVVDTVHGPIECSVGAVLNKKGSNYWMLTYMYEMPSGEITTLSYHCRPHPDKFERR